MIEDLRDDVNPDLIWSVLDLTTLSYKFDFLPEKNYNRDMETNKVAFTLKESNSGPVSDKVHLGIDQGEGDIPGTRKVKMPASATFQPNQTVNLQKGIILEDLGNARASVESRQAGETLAPQANLTNLNEQRVVKEVGTVKSRVSNN